MNGRDVRGLIIRYLPLVSVVTIAGLLHRRAAVDAWADDRSVAAEPSWLQMAAPLWHVAVHDSPSLANALVRLIDPLTAASTAGDVRALAALLAASSAGVLFLALQRAGVSPLIGFLLCGATVASVLPVTAAASVGHALQMFLGTALILTWLVSSADKPVRTALLLAITGLGAIAHASFLAFAAAIWIAEWLRASKGSRRRVAIVGISTLAVSLLVSSWLLAQPATAAFERPIDRPDTLAMVVGLLTGRFMEALQPMQQLDLLSALRASVPAPMILSIPLAALAFARRESRPLASACVLATVALITAVWGAWLPDPVIAGAPARLAVIVLIALGLSWVAAQPGKGGLALAVAASALIGLHGFVEPIPWSVPVKSAQMQAFVEAAPTVMEDATWSADRLAVSRALLSAHRVLLTSRAPGGAETLSVVSRDRLVIAIGSDQQPIDETRVWKAPFDLSYPSASRFLTSLPDRLWMTVGVHGRASDGFCGDLLARLNADAPLVRAENPTLVARVGDREPRASIAGADRLDLEYGHVLANAPEPLPLRVGIEATPAVRIFINRQIAARTDRGMAIATFDPWTGNTEGWEIGPCERPMLPAIRDQRLAAAYVMELRDSARPLRLPALASSPMQVQFDAGDWFVSGWHGAEGRRGESFRWTAALEAHVNVPVARPQTLRIRMNAALAAAPGVPNALGVSWNDTVVQAIGPWGDSGDWIVPASLVRRGNNILTIRVAQLVSPAASGTSTDTRTLGAVIHSLSFEPVTGAP